MNIYTSRMRFALVLAVLAVVSCTRGTSSLGSFELLIDQAWEYDLKRYPLYATDLGDRRFDQYLYDNHPDRLVDDTNWYEQLIVELANVSTDEKWQASDRFNLELLRASYERRLLLANYDYYWAMPLNHRSGVQLFQENTVRMRFDTPEHASNWVARIGKLPGHIDQLIENARRGMELGFSPVASVVDRVQSQLRAHLDPDPKNSPIYREFERKLPEDFPQRDSLLAQMNDTIRGGVIESYQKLYEFVSNEYAAVARREGVGISQLPKGSELYEQLAKYHTTTTLTPQEIHDLGLELVEQLRAEILELSREINFDGTYEELLVKLRTDPQYYFDNPEDLLVAYRDASKRADPALAKLFGTLPRTPYGVRKIPDESAPDTTTAYYLPPSLDGKRPGWYYVNLYQPEKRPKFEVDVLTLHEAMPGHHLQIALAQEIENVPQFRRISRYTAFVEGWGLYAETLGYDMGMYRDVESKIGQKSYQMWRAVRLVVDTGMHYFGWSRQEAIDFFAANAPRPTEDIVNEIDRYIVMPGQALAYMVGKIKIDEIRSDAEARKGSSFDIREFHDMLLEEGAMPLDMLEERMRHY